MSSDRGGIKKIETEWGLDTDPAALHSAGWVLQEAREGDDPRTVPDPNRPPPTLQQCALFKRSIDRIYRFYEEGEDKQTLQREKLDFEKEQYEMAQKRVKAQMASLEKYSATHPTRRRLEGELQRENALLQRKLDQVEQGKSRLDVLWKKREEICETTAFMRLLLDEHCKKLGFVDQPSPPPSSSSSKGGGGCPV
ncbi:hypothetical protein QOT17_000877 [Balamuthia mandrillaris]